MTGESIKPMRIAVVIERFHPTAGGNERSTAQIVERLARRGHAVTVLTSHVDADPIDGVTVVSADRWNSGSAWGLWRFRRWAEDQIERGDFDVSLSVTLAVAAHVVQPRGGTVKETLARNIARRSSATNRNLKRLALAFNPKQLTLLRSEARTLNHPRVKKKVVAISRYVADQLFHHYTVASRRIVTIPNAAWVARLDDAERSALRRRVRTQWRIGEDDVVFLFAAMNPGLKGLGSLLQAMQQVVAERPDAKLLVAGSEDHGDVAQAQTLGIGDHVRWVGITRRIDTLYAACDVTVLPTWYDPSSKVVIESLLHGVPAISTRYNGASQWIADPVHGAAHTSPFPGVESPVPDAAPPQPAGCVIDSPQAIDQLAAAMLRLCDADQRRQCSAAASTLDQRLTMDWHVDELERTLAEAAAAK